MTPIDDLDTKILIELLKDARKSFVKIAKENGVSKEVITTRYKRMEEKGIIVGSTIQVNFKALGYAAVGNILINAPANAKNNILQYLEKIPQIKDIYQANGEYNITTVVILKTLDELDQIKELLRKQGSLYGLRSSLWLEVRNVPENIFCKGIDCPPRKNSATNKEKNFLDSLDKRIIELLSKNSLEPFSSLAKELKSTTNTMIRRYERLKKEHILKTVILLDLKKIGFKAFGLFSLALTDRTSTEATIQELSVTPNIYHIVKTSGDFDLFVIACMKNFEDYFEIKERIDQLPGVRIRHFDIGEVMPAYPGYCTYLSSL